MDIKSSIIACGLICSLEISRAAQCSYSISPASTSPSASATSGSFSVTVGNTCSWAATTTNSWLHTTSSGSGNGTVNYTVDANSDPSPRAGGIVVGTKTFAVNQAAAPMTLSSALNTTNLVWQTASDYPWFGTNNVSHDGVASATSSNRFIANSTSWLQTTVVGPGTVGFWWKVDSDVTPPPPADPASFDFLEFDVNGVQQDQIMGQIDWNYREFPVPEGTNTLTWQYVKDSQFSTGNDRGWLDQVTWSPGAPISLPDALDTCGVDWTSDGTIPTYWAGQTNVTHDGKSAARSGTIYLDQETWMEAAVSGVSNVSFWWKVSSQTNFDFLEFYTNGTLARRISGEVNWQSNSFNLPLSSTILKWRFVMTNGIYAAQGQEAAWVDQVLLSPAVSVAPIVTLLGSNPMGVECHGTFTDPGATANDACSGAPLAVKTNGVVNPDVLGTYSIQYVSTNASGGSTTNTRTVNVVDTTAPQISLNGVNPMSIECHSAFIDPGAAGSDNCAGTLSVTTSGTVLTNSPGVYTITYVASDPSGNSTTNTRTVNVVDTTPPAVLYHFTNLVLNANGNCQASLPDLTGTNFIIAADSCSSVVVTQMPPAGTFFAQGTNLVILTALDSTGNFVNSSNTVTVVDTTAPVISYHFTNLVLSANSNCQAVLPDLTGTNFIIAADNCSSVVITQMPPAGTLLAQGTNVVLLTAVDSAGNFITSSNTMMVVDTTAPVISYHFTNLVLSANSNCQAALPDLTGTNFVIAADNCSSVVITQSPSAGTLLGIGTNLVVLTASDLSGNFSRSTNTVTVVDTTPPVITVLGSNPMTLECHSTFTDPGVSAVDNCAGSVTTITSGTVLSNSPGVYTITYVATDASGNSSTNTRTVTVVDTTPPSILYHFTNLILSAGSNCQVSMPDLTGTNYILTFDACSSVTVTQNPPVGVILSKGTNPVVLTALDVSGNISSVTDTVVVVDTTAPILIAPATVVVSADPGQCGATNVALGTANASDNCQLAGLTNNAPPFFPVGTNLVTWTANDADGNSTNATQLVIVNDTQPPGITCPQPITVPPDSGQSYASSVNLGTPVTSDNCGIAGVTNDAPAQFPIGTNLVTWIVFDTHGNSNSCVQQVIVSRPPQLPHRVTGITNNGDGTFTVTFLGTAGVNYVVQVSSNLMDWSPVQTNQALEDGTWSYTDHDAGTAPSRFYRAMRQ